MTADGNDGCAPRCPYCIVGAEFRLMIGYKDGQFVCTDCSHQERPGKKDYRCSCPHCMKLAMGLSSIAFTRREGSADHAHY
jgi:hypothetical protein